MSYHDKVTFFYEHFLGRGTKKTKHVNVHNKYVLKISIILSFPTFVGHGCLTPKYFQGKKSEPKIIWIPIISAIKTKMQLKDASVHCKKTLICIYLHRSKYTAEVLIGVLVLLHHHRGNMKNEILNTYVYIGVKA